MSKAKFKIAQLAAVDQVTTELVHPKHGDTGIEVVIAGPTHPKWREALKVFGEAEGDDETRGKVLFAAAVLGWDEEAMGPYSKEAVLALISDEKQMWFSENIVRATQDHAQFFL